MRDAGRTLGSLKCLPLSYDMLTVSLSEYKDYRFEFFFRSCQLTLVLERSSAITSLQLIGHDRSHMKIIYYNNRSNELRLISRSQNTPRFERSCTLHTTQIKVHYDYQTLSLGVDLTSQ
jgi:hypothetical protein